MAAPQPIENPQRSYEVFEKKHDMECTTSWPAWRLMPYPQSGIRAMAFSV